MLLLNKESDAGITGFKEKKLFPQKINNRIVVIGPEFLKFLCSYEETFNKFSGSDREMLSCCLGLFCLDSFAEAGAEANFPATHMYLFVNICLLITARAELFFQLTQVELNSIFETEIDCI